MPTEFEHRIEDFQQMTINQRPLPIMLATITRSASSSDKPNAHGTILLIRKNVGSGTVAADT